MRAIILGFLAAAIIGFFEIKENVYTGKKKEKKNFEYKKTQVDMKSDQERKESNYKFVLWMCLIVLVAGIIGIGIVLLII